MSRREPVCAVIERDADREALAGHERARIERLPLAHPPWDGFPAGAYAPPAPGGGLVSIRLPRYWPVMGSRTTGS